MTNTPRIRFKGFTDDWEQRKFSDGVSEVGDGLHGTPTYSDDGDVYFVNGNNLVDGNIVINSETKTVDDSQRSVADKSLDDTTILMSINGTIGNLAYYSGEKLMLGKSAAYIKVSEFDKKFVYAYLQAPSVKAYFMDSLTGTTIKNLGLKAIREMKIIVPQDIEEQNKIGEYFSNLDNLITLHQRKYDNLVKTKKSMLQKMFPRDGATVPEIRFEGFTDVWEQRKLGEVLEIVNNKNGDFYGKEDVLSVSDEYGCINQIRFQGRSFAGEDISNYKIVETGYIVYTRSPLKSKPYGIIKVVGDETGIVSPLYIVNKAKPGNDSEFIYRVFDSPEKTNTYLSPLVRKGAKNTMNISNDEWLSGEIIVAPSFDEQQKIGEYFKQLDNLITLYQRKYDTLQSIKKYMLQNMFPKED